VLQHLGSLGRRHLGDVGTGGAEEVTQAGHRVLKLARLVVIPPMG
jgi:hypothetical protein